MGNNLWITAEELGDNYAYTEFTTEAIKMASYLLWAMSGRKYTGETTVTERYTCTLRNNRLGPSRKTTSPILFGGDMYNIPSGDYDEYSELTADGMSPDSRIKLRGRPVTKIHSMRNRVGAIINPSNYYLVDHSTIHVKAGTAWTPCNTEVTYSYGTPVPVAGKMAARTLATEFIKLWSDDDTCQLPQRVTSVSRQGVSYTILDNQEFIDELRTGLLVVDLFLKTVNPDNARRKAKVFSVDTPRARRYSPKPLKYTSSVDYDIVIAPTVGTSTSWSSLDKGLNLSNFFPDSGWTAEVTIQNYDGTKSVDLPSSSIVVNQSSEVVVFDISYSEAMTALGMVDPGIWTLYATKMIDGIENIVTIASGNLQIKMYS
jgi:hypothetical protein